MRRFKIMREGEDSGKREFDIKTSEFAFDSYELVRHLEMKHRSSNHFQNHELDSMRRKVNRHTDDNNDNNRVLYILKELPEDRFKTSLMKKDRKYKKERAILDIYEVFNDVMSDSIRTVYEICRTGESDKIVNIVREQLERMENIRKYCNIELMKISQTYKQVTPWIKMNGYTETRNWHGYNESLRELGFDFIYEQESLSYDSDLKRKIPKILCDSYEFPKMEQEIEDLFTHYKEAYRVNRGRRNY
jgi:hypothetical protein